MVREDRTNTFETRVWLGRERVADRDGPPIPADPRKHFCSLRPNAQYRIEVHGTRKKQEEVCSAYVAKALDLREEDGISEDKASCSCLWGNPCVNEYGCKDWGNRFEIARKNGWSG